MNAASSADSLRLERRLIVNADDFGLTEGVNDAILELNAAGMVTSATLMATGKAFRSAVHSAFVQTSLDIGCHIVLVDGAPVLPHTSIPSLATAEGFRPTLGAFVRDLLRSKIKAAEIEAEAAAQIQRLQSSGMRVSHVDTHKHTHMFARVLAPLVRAALAAGVPAIRNPFEPAWSLGATPSADAVRRSQVRLLGMQRRGFQRCVHSAGMRTTDGAIGVLATGSLDASALRAILNAMPPGTWELVCHPGHHDAALDTVHTRLRASRAIEHSALLATLEGQNLNGIELVNFTQIEKRVAEGHS